MDYVAAPDYATPLLGQTREENVAITPARLALIDPPAVPEPEEHDAEIHSAQEALGYARPEAPKARKRVYKDAEAGQIPPPPETYSPAHIHAIRLRLGLKQRQFAEVLNVSDKAVKAWEQGVNPPSGPALRLLQIAEIHPELFQERLRA